jgi:EAL domain-containing protein (putative c-di-GMP-specific phosphodiesterase class I)
LEELELIDDLGWLAADRALAEVKLFAGKTQFVPRLALNISVHSLRDLKFPDRLQSLLGKHGVLSDGIILEITESGLIRELSRTLDVLSRLRVKGVRLSIDDFGTGYAMMQQLVNMHINSGDRVMVEKSIELGHAMGMYVVAEGVETAAQFEFLRRAGCDAAQGYFFTHPLPPSELVHWMDDHQAQLDHATPQFSG